MVFPPGKSGLLLRRAAALPAFHAIDLRYSAAVKGVANRFSASEKLPDILFFSALSTICLQS
jgi:hypothetical protein